MPDVPPVVTLVKEDLSVEEITVKSTVYASSPVQCYTEVKTLIKEEVVEEPQVSESDIELLALVTMAEAEGESEYGKRLVISTILNRVDVGYMGAETISDVIYQPSQFSSMWNGRVDRCYVDEDICQLVREELESRSNYEVMYFHAGKYGKYGTPMFAEGNHYFSSV
jgi:N-acetylmuramoyl-L-alanine amidase